MKKLLWLMAFMVLKIYASEPVMVFPELVNPAAMVIHKNMIFISERAHIYIYDILQKKLLNKMGREGDGPTEFRTQSNINNGGLFLSIQEGKLLANSLGKVTFFTSNGRYEKEMKTFSRGSQFLEMPKGFLGIGVIQENDGTEFYTLNLYNVTFKRTRELHRHVIWNDRKFLDPIRFTLLPLFARQDNKIFISSTNSDGDIFVFDDAGGLIQKIRFPYPRKKVNEVHRTRFNEHFNSHPGYKGFLDQCKGILHYDDYFPIIRHLHVEGNRIYVITFNEEGNERCCYVFDLKGTFLGKTRVNIPEISPIRLPPFHTQGDFFYVLRSNDQDDTWYLEKTEIGLHQ